MSVLASLACRIDDFLNPIVVKELRQAVRSRFVSGILMLLLLIQLAVVSVAVMFSSADTATFSEGRQINAIIYGVMLFSCILFVPMYAGVRLAWERSETQMDLMYTTTISPGAIVRGKLFGAAVVTALIFGACMPFMTFTYLLRGVDLPTVFFLLAIGFVEVMAAVQFAIFIACVPTSRLFKVLLGLVALVCLWVWAGMCAAGLPQMLFGSSMIYGGLDWWSITLTLLGFTLLGIGLMYVLSVALISPPSIDRMRSVRFYLMALWLVSGLIAALWAWSESSWTPWEFWANAWAFSLAMLFPISLSERETWGPRIRRNLPRSLLGRAVAMLFTTGSVGSFFWVALMCLLTWAAYTVVTAAFQAHGVCHGPVSLDVSPIVIGITLYGMAYGLTAVLLRKLAGLVKLNIPVGYTWLIAYLMITLGSLAPYLICFFFYYNEGPAVVFQDRPWIVTAPIMLVQREYRTVRLIVAAFWAIGAFVAVAPWLLRQVAAFRREEPVAAAAAPAVAPAVAPSDALRGGSPDPPRDVAPPAAPPVNP